VNDEKAQSSEDLAADEGKALINITFDLEMSRHYPERGMTEWDYQKGNLDDESKAYTVEACRQVKAKGGVVHSFVVGQVLEHKSVEWLKGIIDEGHPVGNHTYDHVRITATKTEDVQYRFRRSPWLIAGMTPAEAIYENIRLCEIAMQQRLGIKPAGFGAPYSFSGGIAGRPDVQKMLLSLGYTWVGSKYAGPNVRARDPVAADYDAFVAVQKDHQPFIYPTGLIEIPCSPPTDVDVFRSHQWKLDEVLRLVERLIEWTIENRAMFDLGVHPSIMYVEDPEFKIANLMCDMVNAAGDRAAMVDLGTFAERAKLQHVGQPAAKH